MPHLSKQKILFCSAMTYFLVTLSFYSVHDFTYDIFKVYFKNDRDVYLFFCLNILRTLSFLISMGMFRSGISIGLLLGKNMFIYFLSLVLITIAISKNFTSNLYGILISVLYFYGGGGAYVCLDSSISSLLAVNNLMDYYRQVRFAIPLGHLFSYIPGYIVDGYGSDKHLTKLYLGCLYSLIAVIFIFFFLRNISLEITSENKKDTTDKNSNITTFKIIGLYLIILFQGLMKAAISITQRNLFYKLNYTESNGNTLHIARILFELILGAIIFAKNINYDILIIVSLIFALIRPIFYTVITYDNRIMQFSGLFYIFLIGEISKSVLSGLWIYAISIKIYSFFKHKNNIYAQSIYNMMYIGLSLTLASFFLYLIYDGNIIYSYCKLYLCTSIGGILSIFIYALCK